MISVCSVAAERLSLSHAGRSQLPQPYAWFDYDNHAGTLLAAEHCLQQGLTRLAYLGGNEPCTYILDRRHGFIDALTQHQPPIAPTMLAALPVTRRAGYQQTQRWLAQDIAPQAIITDCAPLGEGAAIALQQADRLSGARAIPLYVYDGLPHDSIIDHPVNAILQLSQQRIGERVAEMVCNYWKVHRLRNSRRCGNRCCASLLMHNDCVRAAL